MPLTAAQTVIGLTLVILPLGGLMARGWIAAFRTAAESIDSPQLAARWTYRSLVFSLYGVAAFLATPALLHGIGISLPAVAEGGRAVFLLSCLPLAVLLCWLDFLYIRWCDTAKLAARKRLASKRRAAMLGASERGL